MEPNFQNRITKREIPAASNLVEDICSEPTCGITIFVDKDDKTTGRKSRCTACLMRSKLSMGIK
jgi:hypothetical protein